VEWFRDVELAKHAPTDPDYLDWKSAVENFPHKTAKQQLDALVNSYTKLTKWFKTKVRWRHEEGSCWTLLSPYILFFLANL